MLDFPFKTKTSFHGTMEKIIAIYSWMDNLQYWNYEIEEHIYNQTKIATLKA